MRAVREQPRVVALRVLVVACLVGAGFVLGALATGNDADVGQIDRQHAAVELALVAARGDLGVAEADLRRTAYALRSSRARVRALERANRRTTRALRDARRAARRARRNR